MKRFLLLILSLLLSLTACGAANTSDTMAGELGLDVSAGEVLSAYDTHSGNGDGVSCTAWRFQDEALLEQLQSAAWSAFPLDDTVQALVYGLSSETSQIGPYLTDGEGAALVPEIQNGYYLLLDRQTENGLATGADILHRSSFNLTLGLYDTDTHTLYICKLDT